MSEMLKRSGQKTQIFCCAFALWSGVGVAVAADLGLPANFPALLEIRHLSKFPPELAKTLAAAKPAGWEFPDTVMLADLQPEPGASNQGTIHRWFLLGGLSKTYALVAIEEREYYPAYHRIHANGFSLVGTNWVANGEWMLRFRPHTVEELVRMVQSPESQALTATWQEALRYKDLQRRINESDPARWYVYHRPFREINISDEEVREIEAAVRVVMPGAIVIISGVERGCPCEDGPSCTAQVWTAVHRLGETTSLELSDIGEHWVIGPVQQWFLDQARLQRTAFPTAAAYTAAKLALEDRYPACTGESNPQ